MALKFLRRSEVDRYLWIDALCIDQSSLQERSDQVAKMGMIYREAATVVVWLGDSWTDSNLAMEFLQQLGTDSKLHPIPSSMPPFRLGGVTLDAKFLQAALIRFFTLPWWSRVWTVQEFVLARHGTLQCGEDVLDAGVAKQAVRNFFDHQTSPDCCFHDGPALMPLFSALYVMDSLNFTSLLLHDRSLLYNIVHYRSRQATNDRDKVYGVLALGKPIGLKPDYALSVEGTFEQMARASIRSTG